jgi:hypothetical protein
MKRDSEVVIGHWSLVTGHWLLVTGHWLLVIGYWSFVTSHLPLVTRGMVVSETMGWGQFGIFVGLG